MTTVLLFLDSNWFGCRDVVFFWLPGRSLSLPGRMSCIIVVISREADEHVYALRHSRRVLTDFGL